MRYVLSFTSCGILLIGAAWASQEAPAERSTFRDTTNGFTLETPRFPKLLPNQASIVVAVTAPAVGPFASNVNVTIQTVATTRQAYRDRSTKEFTQLGLKLVAERNLTVSGRDAVILDYAGRIQDKDLHFLSLAVFEKARVLLVTCTALESEFPKHEAEFRACLESFKVE